MTGALEGRGRRFGRRDPGVRRHLPDRVRRVRLALVGRRREDEWAGTSNEKELGDFAWDYKNRDEKAQEVGKKKANGFGLHDMSGNVWEWVENCWHKNYQGAPEDGSAWLEAGGGNCGKRVIRGGSWTNRPDFLRTSLRYWSTADFRLSYIGFRLAQDTP